MVKVYLLSGYLLSVNVQCMMKTDANFLTEPCRKPAGNCVRRFGFRHRLRKVFGPSAAVFIWEDPGRLKDQF